MAKIYLSNGSYLCFNQENFDKWCVYEISQTGSKKAFKDIEYFNELYKYTLNFDKKELYKDFVTIYDLTTNNFDYKIIPVIKNISTKYGIYKNDIFKIFSLLYMGMIAENNKENTKLGKRIKRLGVYYLLIENKDPNFCANSMRGHSSKEINDICLKAGF